MYAESDPRAVFGRSRTAALCDAETGLFTGPPDQVAEGRASWLLRGPSVMVMFSQLSPGGRIDRPAQPDEYMLLTLDPGLTLRITTPQEEIRVSGPALTVVPPGPSRITAEGNGDLAGLFTTRAADLAAICPNAPAPDPALPPFQPWPDPPGGFRLRSYPLADPQPGHFGRIYRCTTLMVNVLAPRTGPRDPATLSPHSHADFEQLSLALAGRFTHLLRWPWGPDRAAWRADAAIDCPAPSACVIPAGVIHTSLSTAPGLNQLVDAFAPPRADFSLQDGWVLNAADYPLPRHLENARD